MKEVVVWAEELITFNSAAALIGKYTNKGCDVTFFTKKKNIPIAKRAFKSIKIKSIESIDSNFLWFAHNFYTLFLTPPEFSKLYINVKLHKFGRFLYSISEILKLYKLNFKFQENYIKVFGNKKNIFSGKLVVSFSRLSRPYLFCKSLNHIHIMDSWDHPVKSPWFLSPSCVLTWNSVLKNDIIKYQKIDRIKKIRPLKFNYIKEKPVVLYDYDLENEIKNYYNKDLCELNRLKADFRVLLYSMSYSEASLNAFHGEIKFVKDFLKIAKKTGYAVFIKPKPLKVGVLLEQEFIGYDNVVVGNSPFLDEGGDLLSYEYNEYRIKLLQSSDCVFDCGSTFIIDSSFFGSKTIKLKINIKGYSRDFDSMVLNPHLIHLDQFATEINSLEELEKVFNNIESFQVKDKINTWLSKW